MRSTTVESRTEGKLLLRVILLILAVALIAAGILLREHLETESQAVRICLDCIGIGR